MVLDLLRVSSRRLNTDGTKSPILFCITALGETGPETIITIAIETLNIMGRVCSGFLLVIGYRDTIVFPSFSFWTAIKFL